MTRDTIVRITTNLSKEVSMKKSVVVILCILFAVQAFAEDTAVKEKTYDIQKCASPAGTVMVGKVLCKAATCNKEQTPQNAFIQGLLSLSGQPSVEGIGDGMADMLLTALKKTGCVEIMEREGMEQLKKEMALSGLSMNITPADYMIMGSVNSIRVEKSNTNLGGGVLPVLSSVDVKKTRIAISFDIRLVHVPTGKIIFTNTYEGNNEKTGIGIGAAGGFSGLGFGGIYSSLKGTPVEEVARDVIIRAAIDIVGNIQHLKASASITPPANQTMPSQAGTKPEPSFKDPEQREVN
jgi:curli biogenesis system outer membrane secretion channel CsgG